MKTYDLVVIGSGSAGFHAARAARAENSSASIVVLQEEDHNPYDRTLLARSLADGLDETGLALQTEDWYRQQKIELRRGVTARTIEREQQHVRLDGGDDPVGYRRLVVATGSEPVLSQIARNHSHDSFYVLRTIDDAHRFLKAVKPAKSVLIAGMGILAVEVADQLRKMKKTVTLVGATPQLMPRQLNTRAAEILEEVLSKKNVKLFFQEEIMAFDHNKKGKWTVEMLRETVHCDVVAFCIGVMPRKTIAVESGIECGRGIRVDPFLCTSDPTIYAAGDCAEHPDGTITQLWEAAATQGAVAGGNAVREGGEPVTWDALPHAFRSRVFDQDLFSAGKPQIQDDYECEDIEDGNRYYGLYLKNDAVHGVISLNDVKSSDQLVRAVRERWNRTALYDYLL